MTVSGASARSAAPQRVCVAKNCQMTCVGVGRLADFRDTIMIPLPAAP